ncbi:HD domain-containing protein [Candidatus Woesearchaeota archaeon]|nr:HD domain-containing protein [Candidatus Woesearchaeota archaeon]
MKDNFADIWRRSYQEYEQSEKQKIGFGHCPILYTEECKMNQIVDRLYNTKEVSDLEKISDKNDFHTEPNVLVHTRAVEDAVQNSLTFDYVKGDSKKRLEDLFNERVGDHTRAQLMRCAAVLHDIGKAMTYDDEGVEKPVLQVKENGDTTCPKHADIGSEAAYKVLLREGFSEKEASYVRDVIKDHMRLFNLYDSLADAKNPEKTFNKTVSKLSELYINVLVHTRADLMGCTKRPDYKPKQLTLNGKTYNNEIEFLNDLISDSMRIPVISSVEDVEKNVESRTVYVASGFEHLLKDKLTQKYAEQMKSKVESGKIKPEQLDSIVSKRVDSVMSRVKIGDAPTDYKTVLAERPVQYH